MARPAAGQGSKHSCTQRTGSPYPAYPDLLSFRAISDHVNVFYLLWKCVQAAFNLYPHVTIMSEVVPQVTLTQPASISNNAPVVPTVSVGSPTSTIGKTGDNASDGALPVLITPSVPLHQLCSAGFPQLESACPSTCQTMVADCILCSL